MTDIKSICVYCGCSDKIKPIYLEAAHQMGAAIARRGLGLVYGAGRTGLMGAVADSALEHGGEVIGILPKIFNTPQLAHKGLTRLEVVADMRASKARFAELSDAFIALPGGYGTLDEFFETLTWAQVGIHAKPIGLLNTKNFYAPLLQFFDRVEEEGFIYPEHRDLFIYSAEPEKLLDGFEKYRPPDGLERWVERE